MDPKLSHLADLIRQKNEIETEIARLVGRPALTGHVGEFIASLVFDIQLDPAVTQKGYDGVFRSGALAGRKVDIKWYGKQEGCLDINPGAIPDIYLVMTGPVADAVSSKGKVRPWTIEHVYLFDAAEVVRQLTVRQVKMGAATSIPKKWWEPAEVYPANSSKLLRLSPQQTEMLALFGKKAG